MPREISDESDGVDLFGEPIQPIRPRWGRPSFAKTTENQELVSLLKAAGWSQSRIARYLGCDDKTLRRHFSRELEMGTDLIEGMALQVMLKKMRAGNSVAIGRILDMVDEKGHPAPPITAAKPEKPEKLGKKAAAEVEAHTAHQGTGWGEILKH